MCKARHFGRLQPDLKTLEIVPEIMNPFDVSWFLERGVLSYIWTRVCSCEEENTQGGLVVNIAILASSCAGESRAEFESVADVLGL